jgi:membrane fusion protein, multidrug efflux system
MVEKQSANIDESTRTDISPRAKETASVEQRTKSAQTGLPFKTVTSANDRPRWKRRLVMGVLAALVLAAIGIFGIPWIRLTLNTVSTDDAYVNGHVTFVAARVSGQVTGAGRR